MPEWAISSVGYFLALIGAWLLFHYAPPDTEGTIPTFNSAVETFQESSARRAAGKLTRKRMNWWGFVLVFVGGGLQLVGTILAGIHHG